MRRSVRQCNFSVRIEHGKMKGVKISNGFCQEGSRITTSANRCVLFNILQNSLHIDLTNMKCADLCCGSGIIGFEMLSLGAKECVFIDSDFKKISDINHAIQKYHFNGSCVQLYLSKHNLKYFTNFFRENSSFDLIFFDPPYENDFCQAVIDTIFDNDNNILSDNGILIIETKYNIEADDITPKNIGDKTALNNVNYTIRCVKKLKNGASFYFLSKLKKI